MYSFVSSTYLMTRSISLKLADVGLSSTFDSPLTLTGFAIGGLEYLRYDTDFGG